MFVLVGDVGVYFYCGIVVGGVVGCVGGGFGLFGFGIVLGGFVEIDF